MFNNASYYYSASDDSLRCIVHLIEDKIEMWFSHCSTAKPYNLDMTPFTRRENTEAQCRDAHTDALSVAITCLSPPIPEDAPTFIGICVPARILSEHWDVIEGFFSDKYTFGERSSRQLYIPWFSTVMTTQNPLLDSEEASLVNEQTPLLGDGDLQKKHDALYNRFTKTQKRTILTLICLAAVTPCERRIDTSCERRDIDQ